MRSAWSIGIAASILTQAFFLNVAAAAVFPDVPDDHLYREPIERLVGLKIINGNPDGRFSPSRSVNRAEMLTMLYRALGRTPDPAAANFFPDVVSGSWYESVVSDAAMQHYVEGYSDGTFRPQKEVNRVEALKMIMNMFHIPVGELTDQTRSIVKFVDVSLSAWYTKYLYAAFTNGILPIAGQIGPRFYPDAPLLRGEAAAYIFNALSLMQPSEDPLMEQPSSEAATAGAQGATVTTRQGAKQTSSLPPPTVKQVDFPFNDDGTFTAKRPNVYRFMLATAAVVDLNVRLTGGMGEVTCRLFKLTDQGLSSEYYLGLQVKGMCKMRVALTAGSYQIDTQPTVADAPFALTTRPAKSDGNDGFSEAKILTKGTPRSAAMDVDDYADWYKFTVGMEASMQISLAADQSVTSFIYPMEDVDLYGFTGPVVNQKYTYPPGRYYVGVRRGDPGFGKQSYTIQLK